MFRLPAILFCTACALAGVTLPAAAHPHVLVSVRTVVVADAGGAITALRHAWTFDEAFSAFSTTGLDKNKDGKLDREELAELAQVNVESLNEYEYFSFLKQGRAATKFSTVSDYYLSHDGKALTLHFTLPVDGAKPSLTEAQLEVYDPTFFVAFNFQEGTPVTVEGTAKPCEAKVSPPSPGVMARLSQMGEGFFQSMGPNANPDWAIPVRFSCK
ncbi:DUF1007 family protein [Rhabdaerophilum sp. SD176]|uniref:DUF1007 family protein n=1 Tax=Rhabdaerophilum sp. SD176 TaxID=2983548 RepID=UPI0024DF3A36|nr:DUF1007 family protein [Rhabdaerophilum sp. SD176]